MWVPDPFAPLFNFEIGRLRLNVEKWSYKSIAGGVDFLEPSWVPTFVCRRGRGFSVWARLLNWYACVELKGRLFDV